MYQVVSSKYTATEVYYLFIVSSLIVVFFTDLFYGIIPNIVIFTGTIISLLYLLLTTYYILPTVLFSALGAFLFLLLLHVVTRGKGMGLGDVKLAFFMGLILGWPGILIAFYVAFLTAAIVALILIICGKKRFFKDTLPFGPFLVFASLITLFWGRIIIEKVLAFL